MFNLCGVPAEKFKLICSAIDKLDKVNYCCVNVFLKVYFVQCTWEEVKREMCEEKALDEMVADKIGEFIKISGNDSVLNDLLAGELGTNEDAKKGLQELKLMFLYCQQLKIADVVKFDLSLARGLDYYTGVIYETVLTSGNYECGSIAAGGRYDGLVGMLSDNPKKNNVPCVGVSIGIERIFSIIEEQKIFDEGKAVFIFICMHNQAN